MVETTEWVDDNPFFLVISPSDGSGNVGIDLGTAWLTTHAHLLRVPALWELRHKLTGQTVMALLVHDGEQPYYTQRHIGVTGGGTNEISAYGIGKKLVDGTTQRMWLLPNGVLCSGDDASTLGVMLVKQIGPR